MVNFCRVFEGTIKKFPVWRMAFDRVFCPHSRAFDQRFSKKSNARGFAGGEEGMIAVGIDSYINTVDYCIECCLCFTGLKPEKVRLVACGRSHTLAATGE